MESTMDSGAMDSKSKKAHRMYQVDLVDLWSDDLFKSYLNMCSFDWSVDNSLNVYKIIP